MPVTWTQVRDWDSATQPITVATSGDSSPSREALVAGRRSRPQNQMVYATSVPTSDR